MAKGVKLNEEGDGASERWAGPCDNGVIREAFFEIRLSESGMKGKERHVDLQGRVNPLVFITVWN